VFYEFYRTNDKNLTRSRGSNVEGIGRPRVEPSFIPEVIDVMLQIPNAATYASIYFLDHILGRKCGGSTGTNLYGAIQLMSEMDKHGESGSVVTLICDSGERYLDTYYSDAWLKENGYHIEPYLSQLQRFYTMGEWPEDTEPNLAL
jgi:cysteine synthase A